EHAAARGAGPQQRGGALGHLGGDAQADYVDVEDDRARHVRDAEVGLEQADDRFEPAHRDGPIRACARSVEDSALSRSASAPSAISAIPAQTSTLHPARPRVAYPSGHGLAASPA